jgi:hypothetical protein
METPDFSWALRMLKAGHKIKRAGWNGKGQYVTGQFPDAHSKMSEPYAYLHNAQGGTVPWIPSQGDMFSEDWMTTI